ncbi:MAG: hypothetical protein ABR506_10095 [Candidatus Krumholzibacteriia bacterium]
MPPTAPADWSAPRRVVFLHRSVGGALVRNGLVDMYDVLAELNAARGTNLELWHHFCGAGPYWNRYYDGNDAWIQPNFGPGVEESPSATPEQWERVFCAPDVQYVAARDSLDNFRVILFKSGYDNTIVYASDRAETWRNNYRAMRDSPFFADPERRIIVMGFAPNREGLGGCTQADADSSRAFNDWLEEWFVGDRKNLFVFPLFDQLAGADNWLRDEYEIVANDNDAHPNVYACGIVGRELMTFIHAVSMQEADPTAVPAPRPD